MPDELKPQSIDTLEFRDLLWDIVRTAGNERVIRDVIAHIDAWRVPACMKLVPIEPTPAMLRAARNAPIPMVLLDSISARQDLEAKAKYSAMIAAAPECTRCGGDHPLSQCRWPAVIKGAPGCNGACNQGRSKCTCR
jgi:hypothetical protein